MSEKNKDLKELADPLPWIVGDWLLAGIRLGEKSGKLKERIQRRLKGGGRKAYTDGALGNIMTTCKVFKPSRRRESLSIWYHSEVRQFPEAAQEQLLDMMEPEFRLKKRMKPITFGELKGIIKGMKNSGQLPRTVPLKFEDEKFAEKILKGIQSNTSIRVPLMKSQWDFLKAIDPQSSPGLTAARLLKEYIAVNLGALMARAITHDERWSNFGDAVVQGHDERARCSNPLPAVRPDKS